MVGRSLGSNGSRGPEEVTVLATPPLAANFGIATECGLGRRPREQIGEILDIHAQLAR